MTIELVEEYKLLKDKIYEKLNELDDCKVWRYGCIKDESIYICFKNISSIKCKYGIAVFKIDFCDALEEIFIEKWYQGYWDIVSIWDYTGKDIMSEENFTIKFI